MKNIHKIIFAGMIGAIGGMSSLAWGYNLKEVKKLFRASNKLKGVCKKCDLSKINSTKVPSYLVKVFAPLASNTDVSGSNISGSTFTNLSVKNVNLTNTNLSNTDITNSSITDANLSNADLTGVNFTNAKLKNVILKGAKLRSSAKISGAQYWNGSKYVPITIDWLKSQGVTILPPGKSLNELIKTLQKDAISPKK